MLHRILAECAPVTPAMALRLGKLLGASPDLWIGMQVRHDLWHSAEAMKDELANIPTHRAA